MQRKTRTTRKPSVCCKTPRSGGGGNLMEFAEREEKAKKYFEQTRKIMERLIAKGLAEQLSAILVFVATLIGNVLRASQNYFPQWQDNRRALPSTN
jgi:hypothetical protein